MAPLLLGLNTTGIPFDRTFFSASLDSVLERFGKGQGTRLTLFLSDGSTLDVCQIEELSDGYLVLRAYLGEDEHCELALNAIPYGLIYRIEVRAREAGATRLGFTRGSAPKAGGGGSRASKAPGR